MIVSLTLEEIPPLFEEIAQMLSCLQAEVFVLEEMLTERNAISREELRARVRAAIEQQQEEIAAQLRRRARERVLKERPTQ